MEKITVLLGELLMATDSLRKISRAIETSMAFRWKYSGFIVKVDENLNRFYEIRKTLLEEFKVKEGDIISKEHAKKFEDLLLEEIKFDYEPMPLEEIKKIESFTMEDIGKTEKFITKK